MGRQARRARRGGRLRCRPEALLFSRLPRLSRLSRKEQNTAKRARQRPGHKRRTRDETERTRLPFDLGRHCDQSVDPFLFVPKQRRPIGSRLLHHPPPLMPLPPPPPPPPPLPPPGSFYSDRNSPLTHSYPLPGSRCGHARAKERRGTPTARQERGTTGARPYWPALCRRGPRSWASRYSGRHNGIMATLPPGLCQQRVVVITLAT